MPEKNYDCIVQSAGMLKTDKSKISVQNVVIGNHTSNINRPKSEYVDHSYLLIKQSVIERSGQKRTNISRCYWLI